MIKGTQKSVPNTHLIIKLVVIITHFYATSDQAAQMAIIAGVESYSDASSEMAKHVSISYKCIPAAAFYYILYPII
jgi:hypothetical protein